MTPPLPDMGEQGKRDCGVAEVLLDRGSFLNHLMTAVYSSHKMVQVGLTQ